MDLIEAATLTEEEKEQIVTSVIASYPTNLPEALSDDLAIAARDKTFRVVVEWLEQLYVANPWETDALGAIDNIGFELTQAMASAGIKGEA